MAEEFARRRGAIDALDGALPFVDEIVDSAWEGGG
jgi:hypothetical protein